MAKDLFIFGNRPKKFVEIALGERPQEADGARKGGLAGSGIRMDGKRDLFDTEQGEKIRQKAKLPVRKMPFAAFEADETHHGVGGKIGAVFRKQLPQKGKKRLSRVFFEGRGGSFAEYGGGFLLQKIEAVVFAAVFFHKPIGFFVF